MKVYFAASLHGKVKKEVYKKIVSAIEKFGYKVDADHMVGNSVERLDTLSIKDRTLYHRKMSKAITRADLMVCEVSFPSTINIGHEVTLALDKGKPVVALYQSGKEPGVLQGIHSDRFILMEYDEEDLDDVVGYGLEEAVEKIDIRYNFFISPKMVRFLDMVAKKKRLPKSVFLRNLIEEDMKESGYEE